MNAKENLLRAIRRQDPEYVPYPGASPVVTVAYEGAWARDYRRGRTRWVEELFGVEYESTSDWEGSPSVVGYPLSSLDDLATYRFPDPYAPDRFAGVRDQIASLDRDAVLIAGMHPACLFHRGWTLLSMEGFLTEMALRPEETREFLRRIADFQIGIARQYVAAGVDMGRISDDYGSQKALMVSPGMWREFIKPELARIVAAYKEAGCLVELHSCGHVEEIVGDLIEVGIDVLNPIQARANDLAWLKRTHGDRICFSGGVDSHETLMLGTPEMVANETKERLRVLGPGGGYIIGPDQGMPFPEGNLQALIDTAREYGRYPIAL